MKKLLLFLTLSAVFIACDSEPKTGSLSGKIYNTSNEEISLSRADGTDMTSSIDSLGNFAFEKAFEKGFYTLSLGRMNQTVYLGTGYNTTFNFDAEDFDNSAAFEGDLAPENNYLLAKNKRIDEFNKARVEIYSLDETEFLSRLKKGTEDDTKVLGTNLSISDEFVLAETNNMLFTKTLRMKNYPSYHSYYAKAPEYEMSEAFKSEIPVVDLYNLENYYNFSSYRSLVQMDLNEEVSNQMEADEDLDYFLTFLNAVSNSNHAKEVKADLAYNDARYGITYTEQLDAYYALFKELVSSPKQLEEVGKSYAQLETIKPGKVSPVFTDYENFKGGENSLGDYAGKYVYIDVWAQWCGPCKREIPFLKKVEKEYHDKNIVFMSISIDQEKDYDKWRAMVEDKELSGVQLLADNAWNSKFIQDYYIKGIPRFILVGPDGNIVNSNAPRPSSKKLIKLFDSLNI